MKRNTFHKGCIFLKNMNNKPRGLYYFNQDPPYEAGPDSSPLDG